MHPFEPRKVMGLHVSSRTAKIYLFLFWRYAGGLQKSIAFACGFLSALAVIEDVGLQTPQNTAS